jgi:hypothetical protein
MIRDGVASAQETDAAASAEIADWLRRHRVRATPALIFNGRFVPEEFHDLVLFDEMLEDHWRAPQVAEPVMPGATA